MIDCEKFLKDDNYAEQEIRRLITANMQQLIKDRYLELINTKPICLDALFELQKYCRHPNIKIHMEPCPDCGYEQIK